MNTRNTPHVPGARWLPDAGLFGHLNRIVQSEFKGGTITHIELRDAMTYAVQYMNEKKNGKKPNPAAGDPRLNRRS